MAYQAYRDGAERQKLAKKISRQEFWKEVYLKSVINHYSIEYAAKEADEALAHYDNKFGEGDDVSSV